MDSFELVTEDHTIITENSIEYFLNVIESEIKKIRQIDKLEELYKLNLGKLLNVIQ